MLTQLDGEEVCIPLDLNELLLLFLEYKLTSSYSSKVDVNITYAVL